MGPYRELFVDAEAAIERERLTEAYRLQAECLMKWHRWLDVLSEPSDTVREWLEIESRICAYARIGATRLPSGLILGMHDLL
jgi:hypothetical protein